MTGILSRKKGQVFVIIGIVIAISLVLINIKTNFDIALREEQIHLEMNENEIFANIQNEFKESYDIAVRSDAKTINKTLSNFSMFMRDRFTEGRISILYYFSKYDNSSLEVSVWNFLGREIENVVMNQSLTGGNESWTEIETGEGHKESWTEPGKTSDYQVNLTYTDTKSGKRFTKTYPGGTGDEGIYSALFYRIEMKMKGTEVTGEERGRTKPL